MTFADYLQNQPLLRIAVVLMLGIAMADKLCGYIPLLTLLAAIIICIILELLFKDKPFFQSSLILLAVFLAGMVLAEKSIEGTLDPFPDDVPLHYEAIVTGEPQARGRVLRCDLVVTVVDGKSLRTPIPVKAAILRDTVNNEWRKIKIGSGISAMSEMQPLENYSSKGNFDYVRWLHCHGFRAQTFIFYSDWRLSSVSLVPLSKLERLKLKALRLRRQLVNGLQMVDDESGGGSQQSAVVAAMVLGDKHALSSETKDDFSVSGASHVLALSGLHLGIIYAILTLLFGTGYRWRWLSQSLIIVAIWAYVILVGMGASVIRSAVMLTIYSVCLVSGRDKASINALSLAAIVMLVTNPLCLWDIGFQMSFIAVLAIVIFYRPLFNLMPHNGDITKFGLINKAVKYVWGMAAVSIAAQIGTASLVAYYFGRFSCYFLFTNYIVVPCAGFIIYGALVLFLTAPIHAINNVVAQVLSFVSAFLNSSVSWIATLPGASIDNIRINSIFVFCYYLIIAILCIIHSYLRRLSPLKKLDAFR